MPNPQRFVLWGLLALLLGSVAARGALLSSRTASEGGGAAALQPNNYLATGLGEAPRSQADSGAIEKALPYITEGSLFALIGFALGYATRKVFKVGLIVLALVFIGIQVLVYTGSAQIEWGGVVEWVNKGVLNLKENETLSGFFTKRVPSAGALLASYIVGFRRG
jgi:uncharacterized membrane protein (Fun14 family)